MSTRAFRGWMGRWLDTRRERRVVRRYLAVGREWGDVASYEIIIGPSVGFDLLDMAMHEAEYAYIRLGYKPIPRSDWIEIGGYGMDPTPLLRQPRITGGIANRPAVRNG